MLNIEFPLYSPKKNLPLQLRTIRKAFLISIMGSQNQSPTTSYNTDDSSNYQSIKSVTPLPYPLSDQTATLMPNYYSSSTNSGFRIYLTGGI